MEEEFSYAYFIAAAVSILVVVCFFYLCDNISKIKKLLEDQKRDRDLERSQNKKPLENTDVKIPQVPLEENDKALEDLIEKIETNK